MGNCIICRRILNNPVAAFTNMPAQAQNMPEQDCLDEDQAIELILHECRGCGLIQFDVKPVDYYKDVIRATRVSEKFRRLRSEQYEHFIQLCNLKNKKILEVGCGSGEFLEIWNDFAVEAYGIEHNHSLVVHAQEQGLKVSQGFVSNEEEQLEHAPFDAFVSFNFLEHQPDPVGMLHGISANLTEEGVGLITVPSFEYFQENSSYYEFIRDHIAYYTEETLSRLLDICGFEVLEAKRFNKDTIEMIVKKRKMLPKIDYNQQIISMEKQFEKIMKNYQSDDEVYVWGASHQAFTLLSTVQALKSVCLILDSAKFKWNKYSPVSHIRISSPEILTNKTPKCIIIMAPGYSDEIHRTIIEMNSRVSEIYSVMGEEIVKLK